MNALLLLVAGAAAQPSESPWSGIKHNAMGSYQVAGETSTGSFSTNYSAYPLASATATSTEFFDCVGPPISTHYGQVFWTMQEKQPLPPAFVKRFDGKTIAVVGFEVDQVMANGTSVPINWAYVMLVVLLVVVVVVCWCWWWWCCSHCCSRCCCSHCCSHCFSRCSC